MVSVGVHSAIATVALLFLAPASAGESAPSGGPPDGGPRHGVASARLSDPSVRCAVTDGRIIEASGLAVERDHLYLVNDGGDRLTVFVLDRNCHTVRVRSAPTDPFDVEDLARTPDGTLWFADIGDNRGVRRTVAVESLSPSGSVAVYRFRYPDGPHNAEALLLDRSNRPYLVTKSPLGVSGVYTPVRAPSTRSDTPLRRVTTLRFGLTGTPGGPVGTVSQLLVTGGAVSPDGTRVALRTYTDLYLWQVRDGDVGAALRAGDPVRVALPEERQGESVAFTPDGRSVLTVSEGTGVPVHAVRLPPPDRSAGHTTAPTPGRPALSPSRSAHATSTAERADHSRPVYVNALLAAAIATVIVFGLGRLRRK